MSQSRPLDKTDGDSDTDRIVRTSSVNTMSKEVIAVHLEHIFKEQQSIGKKVDRLLEENLQNREGLAAMNRRVTDVEGTTSWAFRTAISGLCGVVVVAITFVIKSITGKS